MFAAAARNPVHHVAVAGECCDVDSICTTIKCCWIKSHVWEVDVHSNAVAYRGYVVETFDVVTSRSAVERFDVPRSKEMDRKRR